MRRSAVLAALASTALVAGTFSTAVAASAPSDPGPPGPGLGLPAGPPQGDMDGDGISDDFEPRLRAAAASDRVAVIVTGVGPRRAKTAVGDFAVTHRLALIDGFSAEMSAGQARALARAPGVRRVEADGVVRALDDATNADFGATAARTDRPGLDGSGVGICVVDTGVDPNHEQIAPRPVAFADFVGTRTTAYDDHGHGTHVMSIAAGDGNGGGAAATFGGVAPAADLYATKVLDSTGFGSDSDVIAGVEWCHTAMRADEVDVISLSLGDTAPSNGTDALSEAVDAAEAGGDVVVVAAGNSGDAPVTINAPGVARGAITVGAVADWSAPTGTARHDDGIWLAAFSSRGPTIDGRTKPDIAAPGVTVTAADAGTVSGYVTMSGTSMATPYVSGAVALAVEANTAATPQTIRSALLGTAEDRGSGGLDDDWGGGLIDVRAFVDAVTAAADPREHSFPTTVRSSWSVGGYGSKWVDVVVPSDGTGVPLAVMVTVTSGQLNCDFYCQIGWTAGEWSPDLDVELYDPDGRLVADSQCALSGVTCAAGRQETVTVARPLAGIYNLRVYEWSGSSGAGATFDVEVSRGPLVADPAGGGGSGGDPEPEPNLAPIADAGDDLAVKLNKKTGTATFTLDGSGSTDSDGSITEYRWTDVSTDAVTSGPEPKVTYSKSVAGTYPFRLVVTDEQGEPSAHDEVVVTVQAAGGGGGGGKPPRG